MDVQHKNKYGEYPLHTVCYRLMDRQHDYHDVAMKLIEIFPEAAKYRDSYGQYPLHVACHHGQLDDVVMKLIYIFPEAVHKSSKDGAALHYACLGSQSETV